MEKIKEICRKYLMNRKIMFGTYVTIILIGLVVLISSHYESSKAETMASEIGTVDPLTQMATVPEEKVAQKEETRIETLQRLDKEEALRIGKEQKDSIERAEALQMAENKRLEESIRKSLHYATTSAAGSTRGGTPSRRGSGKAETPQDDLTEFEKFKAEMMRLDSLEMSGNRPAEKEKGAEPTPVAVGQTFYVHRDGVRSSPYFNSITDPEEPSYIRAMIDEVVKAKQSSRVRIRLLDDINIDGKVIPQNHYLYAHVTGFGGQRILLSITSMLLKDRVYPVNLEIYDLDGYAGLNVPRSSFQEFMQDFNSNAVNGTNLEVNEPGNARLAQMGYDMLENVISTTRRAMQKKIKTNKAKIKYNTQVLLINANEKYNVTNPKETIE